MKKIFVFVESDSKIFKHEIDPQSFDGNMGNFIAKLAHDYPSDAVYYVGSFA